jgi:phosphoribosyl 1,2-cyclic phosphate phosphodiesterase
MTKHYKIRFLGTGTSQGIPVIGCACAVCKSDNARNKRLRTSALIEIDNKVFLLDAGPDLRQQLLASPKLPEALLITHTHQDHIGGMDDLRPLIHANNAAFPVYCTEESARRIRELYPYAFASTPYPGAPQFDIRPINNACFSIESENVIPIRGLHMKMEVYGFRFGPIAYLTDMNELEDKEIDKLLGVEILVINALRREKHHSHFNVDEAVDIGKRVGARQTYFTHISHHLDAGEILPEGFAFANDGLEVEVFLNI